MSATSSSASLSHPHDDGLYQWKVVDAEPSPSYTESRPILGSYLIENTKARLYNLYHRGENRDIPKYSNSPLTFLGVQYDMSQLPEVDSFHADFESRLWFTYRNEFPRLEASLLTSDLGWGCMVRTGQMMLAHAFVLHFLGRRWRLDSMAPSQPDSALHRLLYINILRWFADSPSPQAVYSIHQLTRLGARFDYTVGECFMPTQICRTLKVAVRNHSPDGITLAVARDGGVCVGRLKALCRSAVSHTASPPPSPPRTARAVSRAGSSLLHSSIGGVLPAEPRWRSLILLIPLRLGVTEINRAYFPALRRCLASRFSLGIVGGKPNSSYWFVGYQDDDMVYYDPHIVQPAVRGMESMRDFPTDTFHTALPKTMPAATMDPSLFLAFYLHDEAALESWLQEAPEINADPHHQLFSVALRSCTLELPSDLTASSSDLVLI